MRIKNRLGILSVINLYPLLDLAVALVTLQTVDMRLVHYCRVAKYLVNFNGIIVLSWLADLVRRRRNNLAEYPPKNGQVAVVTGGARGIGLEVVRGLMKCGMHVVLAVRNVTAGEGAVESIKADGLPGTASVMELDVSSMKSCERFSAEFKKKHGPLHVLVNNAGKIYGEHTLTEDRFESQLGTNYMGHFYLTHLLMDNLIKAGEPAKVARVVNVASCAHYGIHMFFEDFNMEKSYHPVAGYARSKMAQILSTRHLNRMFEEKQLPVRMYAVHPGIVATDMMWKTFDSVKLSRVSSIISKPFKTCSQGATSVVYACVSPDLEDRGGMYVSNCGQGYTDSYSQRLDVQERLYHITRKLLDVNEFGAPMIQM